MKYLWLMLIMASTFWGQTLSQQKMCDEQAHLKFQRNFENSFAHSEYFSHFDVRANVCYLMFFGSGKSVQDDKTTVFSAEVKDAFEGSTYGELYSRICADCSDKPSECYVKPHGSVARVACASAAEFYRLVRKHFGVKAQG